MFDLSRVLHPAFNRLLDIGKRESVHPFLEASIMLTIVGFGFASLLGMHGLVEHSVLVSLEGRAGRIEDLDRKENRP